MTAGEKFGPPADIQGSRTPDELEDDELEEDELEDDEELEDDDELEVELVEEDVDELEDEELDDEELEPDDEEEPPPCPPQAPSDSTNPNSSPYCFTPYIASSRSCFESKVDHAGTLAVSL
jgi:hypothetical protein